MPGRTVTLGGYIFPQLMRVYIYSKPLNWEGKIQLMSYQYITLHEALRILMDYPCQPRDINVIAVVLKFECALESSRELLFFFFKAFIYLFLERGQGREKERKRNINVWLSLAHPQLGTGSTAQAHALAGNPTRDLLVYRTALNPLSHTRQG